MPVVNPQNLTIQGATEFEDGSVYAAEDRAGYTLGVTQDLANPNTQEYSELLSVTTEMQEFGMPVGDLDLAYGQYLISVREVAKNGQSSVWSEPGILIEIQDVRVPKAPTLFFGE